jgi:CheY-like chemotaxis protein
MGGRVRVESELGRGSKFTVELRLPRELPDQAAAHRAAPLEAGPTDLLPPVDGAAVRTEPALSRALHVLVCEDNPVNQMVLLAMLARLGHTTKVANDGLAAWELLERETFDLLLTDIEMPGLDGMELARRVRAKEAAQPGSHLPILGATAHVGEEEQHRLLGAGMDAHLGKPFTLTDLSAALHRAARRE